jgi:hypothetical protein
MNAKIRISALDMDIQCDWTASRFGELVVVNGLLALGASAARMWARRSDGVEVLCSRWAI